MKYKLISKCTYIFCVFQLKDYFSLYFIIEDLKKKSLKISSRSREPSLAGYLLPMVLRSGIVPKPKLWYRAIPSMIPLTQYKIICQINET